MLLSKPLDLFPLVSVLKVAVTNRIISVIVTSIKYPARGSS